MAVFGVVVEGPDRKVRADKAFKNLNAYSKQSQALNYVKERQQQLAVGVSTQGIFYNATGETLTFMQQDDKNGTVDDVYPQTVENGQWGAFNHSLITQTPEVISGSVGFVVYQVKRKDNEDKLCDALIAWSTPANQAAHTNHAYCNIYDDGNVDAPDVVYTEMEASNMNHDSSKYGLTVTATIEKSTLPVYQAIFHLQ